MKKQTITDRMFDALQNNDAIRCNQGKYLLSQKRFHAIESVQFNEYDLRGLSKAEKNYIRENDFRTYIELTDELGNTTKYYLFITKDLTTNKPRLYAFSKHQLLCVNEKKDGLFSFERFLVVATGKAISITEEHYEARRFPSVTYYVGCGIYR